MYYIVLSIFILTLQTSVSQYPTHMDLQKVGEVIFNNEKFNILKPTQHIVSDYFKEFMLRQGDDNFPTKRVFIDDNGLRHGWTGFGKEIKSLRKTDLKHLIGSAENSTKKTGSNINSSGGNENTTASNEKNVPSNDSNENNEHNSNVNGQDEDNALENNDTVEKLNVEENTDTPESQETTITNLRSASQENNSYAFSIEKRLRQGKNDTKAKSEPDKKANTTKTADTKKKDNSTKKADDPKKDKGKDDSKKTSNSTTAESTTKKNETANNKDSSKSKGKDRTVAQTTFFCPFFGVITMSAFID